MFPLLGGLISGISSLFGSSQNTAAQEQIAQENINEQEQFAQHGIQWKVNDAKAAGINPLAALGAQTASFSNVAGATDPGAGISQAGQDLGRAVAAQSSADDRQFLEAQRAQQLQKGDLENAYLASQIRTLNQPGNPPPMPTPGQRYVVDGQAPTTIPGSTASVAVVPQKVTAEAPNDARLTAGVIPEVTLTNQPGGGYYPMPSKDFQGASFGSDWSSFGWDVRNILGPMHGANWPQLPPPDQGYFWSFDPVRGYTQSRKFTPGSGTLGYPWFFGSTPAY